MNSRFRAYLAVAAFVAALLVATGSWLEYLGVSAAPGPEASTAIGLILTGMSLTGIAALIVLMAWRFCRRESDLLDRYQRHPDEPWRWVPAWEAGRIVTGRTFPLTATWVALLWCSLTIAGAFLARDEIASLDREMAWFLPAIPLVGVGLVVSAIHSLYLWRRYGSSTLVLESSPVVPGTAFVAVIETSIRAGSAPGAYRVSLTCRREMRPGVRHSRTRREVTVWRDAADFAPVASQVNPACVAVPVRFVIPDDVPDSTVRNSAARTVWEFRISDAAERSGSYRARFVIPVFATTDTKVTQTSPVASVYRPERVAERPLDMPVSPGVEIREDEQRLRVVFRRGREKRTAGVLLQFSLLWAVMATVVMNHGVHVTVTGALFAFLALPLSEAARLALVERHIMADRSGITLLRLFAGFERRTEIPAGAVDEVLVTAVSDIGFRERYRLVAVLSSGQVMSLAERIPDQVSAQWIGYRISRSLGLSSGVRFSGSVVSIHPRGPIRRGVRERTADYAGADASD